VHVHPGARRESVAGWRSDGALKLEVAARPEDGLANQAVTNLLAEALGVTRSRVSVVRGRTSRSKLIEVEGLEENEVRLRIEGFLAAQGAGQ
jgi:uncharacterized protein YggU (UPF0235/DUF167 family)